MTAMIEKYEYLRRTNALCDLLIAATGTDATTAERLFEVLPDLLAQMPEYHASLVEKIHPEFIAAVLKEKNRNAVRAHASAVKQFLLDMNQGMEEGKPLVGYFPAITPELFYSLGLNPIAMETITLYLAAAFIDGVETELDESEAQGFPGHACGIQRAPFGAFEKDALPMPDVFVKCSAPCNSSNMFYQYTFEKYGVPVLIVDAPYHGDERAFDYFHDEFRQMISDLEAKFDCQLDVEQLRQRVSMGNEQLKHLYALQKLRRLKPNPDPGMHRAFDFGSLSVAGSNQMHVDYMKLCRDEAQQRVDSKTSFLPADKEEIRTLWTWGITGHMLFIYDWLEEEYGASFLECAISNLPEEIVGFVDTTDRDSMIRGLAWRSFNYPMQRTVMSYSDVYVNDMVKIAKDYDAAAAVYSGNQSCRHAWAAAKRISDALMDEKEVPSLTWETDLVDKRYTSHAATRALLGEFFSTFEH